MWKGCNGGGNRIAANQGRARAHSTVEEARYKKIVMDEAAVDRLLVDLYIQSQPRPPQKLCSIWMSPMTPSMAIRRADFFTLTTAITGKSHQRTAVGTVCRPYLHRQDALQSIAAVLLLDSVLLVGGFAPTGVEGQRDGRGTVFHDPIAPAEDRRTNSR
jgi:hypothetical protein